MFQTLRNVALLSSALVLLVGCGTPEERGQEFAVGASEFYAAGDTKRAKLEAQSAVQVAPKNVQARYLLAQIAEAEGQFGPMVGHLEVVIDEDLAHVPARLKLANLLIYAQDYPGANLLLAEVQSLAPDDPDVRLLEARLLFQKGDTAGGIQALDFVIERRPADVEAGMLRGMAYAATDPERGLEDLAATIGRVGKKEAKPLRQARIEILNQQRKVEAVETELKALVADFPEGSYAFDLASFYSALGRQGEAEAALRAAIVANPDNFDLKFYLAQFQSRSQQQPELAEQTLKGFIAENPAEQRLPILLGTFYEASDRQAEAMAQYEAVVATDARSEHGYEARARIATLLLANGKAAEARKAYDSILADAPDNVGALAGRGALNLTERQYDAAVADLRDALRREPDNQPALLALGRTHQARGDVLLAQDAYRRLLQANPRRSDIAVELAQLLQAGRQPDEAEALYRQVLAAEPESLPAGSGLVEALLVRGDLPAAEAAARRLVALNDPRGIAYLQLGKVLQAREDHKGAIDAFRQALGRDPASVIGLRGVAGSLTILGQLDAATAEIRRFLAANPASVDAQIMLAGNLLRRGQTDDARKTIEPIIKDQPLDARGYIILASTYPDDPAAREVVLKRGLAANPEATNLSLVLGTEYLAANRPADAVELYERALAVNAIQPLIANSLAALLLDTRTDTASHQRALQLVQAYATSRNPAVLDTIGWAHYRLKDFARSVTFLEQAAGLESNPVLDYHLGMAYLASGNPVGARASLEKALASDSGAFPGADEARSALEKLKSTAATAKAPG